MADTFERINRVITENLEQLKKPNVLSVRPGIEFTHHWITGRPAIVATVSKKVPEADLPRSHCLPDVVDGVPVDVHQANPLQAIRLTDPKAFVAQALKIVPEQRPANPPLERTMDGSPVTVTTLHKIAPTKKTQIDYTSAPDTPLQPISGQFAVKCLASPDQSWPHLKAFLTATKRTLTVGMYDFTSAHILQTVATALADKKLTMVLDHPAPNATADQSDEQTATDLSAAIAPGFEFVWAMENLDSLTNAWIYPSAYHIKVAVRDGESFWLSSGNWNNSNQPDIDPASNPDDASQTKQARQRDRDWHVIIEHPQLAKVFEAYLAHDHEVAVPHSEAIPNPPTRAPLPQPPSGGTPAFAKFFPAQQFSDQMTVTPLLTPDPGLYVDAVTALVKGAQHTLYLQYQYVEPNPIAPAPFQELIAAVVERHTAGVDVKIITSEFEQREHLELLQNLGFDVVNRLKIQQNVHNKGIVVDSVKVLVSSQNWSSAGVLNNRDAGVIIEHGEVAKFFEAIFLHDWNTLGEHKLPPAEPK